MDIMGGDGLGTPEFWQTAGLAGEGALFTFPTDPHRFPSAAKALEQFKAQNINPEGHTLFSYGVVQAIAEGVKRAGSDDPEMVAKARLFYAVMQHGQLSRQRNGAYGWSIARDIADPELWTERFYCPTWHDYLRQRSRSTATERALHVRANDFHIGPEPIRIRRMLERPIGSVRWKEDTPDRSTADVTPITSPGSGP